MRQASASALLCQLLDEQARAGARRRPLVLLRQAGSAGGLIPALDDWIDAAACAGPGLRPGVIAWPQAAKACRELSRDIQRMDLWEVCSEDQARLRFEQILPAAGLVLSGTSAEAEADAHFWRRARQQQLSAVAYLDQWVNIELRFAGPGPEGWPDVLAVIDPHDGELAAAIAPAGVQIRVTGSPALDNIRRQVDGLRAAGVAPDPLRVVFATEPQPDLEAYRHVNGFCDEDSFELGLQLMRRWHRQATLAIRLHPRDRHERWLRRLPPDLETVWDESSRADSLARAGRVFGMRSFFLLEAAAAGVPVFSLQPQRRTACPLTDGRMPVLDTASDYRP